MRTSLAYPAVALATAVLFGCGQGDQRQAPADRPTPQAVQIPAPEPPLDREKLLLAVMQSASASALAHDDEAKQRQFDGKRFEFRIRFGCGGGADRASPQVRGWNFDERSRVLRVRIEPDLIRGSEADGLVGTDFEDIEGFWVPRPWLLAAGCPQTAAPAPSPTSSSEAEAPRTEAVGIAPGRRDVGIAQVYTATDSRTGRRNSRAFEVTKILDPEQRPSAAGYDLVLAGRLKALPSGKVIACGGGDPDRAPRCVISAQFDHTAIEPAGGGEPLAQWTAG